MLTAIIAPRGDQVGVPGRPCRRRGNARTHRVRRAHVDTPMPHPDMRATRRMHGSAPAVAACTRRFADRTLAYMRHAPLIGDACVLAPGRAQRMRTHCASVPNVDPVLQKMRNLHTR
ncbi:hypothetical protein [Sphingomonas sp. FARSPH]|uniref:hypothetical protein n=1 Tax=Sphingomonas sp. FARSPH TaxID=2219696 RepID=UPI0018E523E3|nr:hypothetical protein [Sphingomonas sp. FARSPH]